MGKKDSAASIKLIVKSFFRGWGELATAGFADRKGVTWPRGSSCGKFRGDWQKLGGDFKAVIDRRTPHTQKS